MTNKEKALALINTFATGDTEKAKELLAAGYIQHNLAYGTGAEAFVGSVAYLASVPAKTTVQNIRAFEDGDKVFLQTVYNFAGAGEQVAFDIFRFDTDGKIAEHWDNLAAKAEPNPSGHTQIDGTLEKKDAELRAFTALRQVGLEETTYYQSPFDLSGGQKRRAAIAGVLAMRPRVLVLDEPTAGLDPKGRDEILSLVKKLHDEEKITIVLVSHSMDDVANYVDRILVMNKSRLVYDAPPKEVFTHAEELEQMGLAIPSVTYAMHALKKNGFDVPVNVTTIDEAVEKIMDCIS